MEQQGNLSHKRCRNQWLLLWIVVITISLGWKYPLLGYTVPLAMLTGIIGSFIRGRYVCGNLCPRGAFLERLISWLSFNRKIPLFFKDMRFRIVALFALMGLMMYRGFQNPSDPWHWGYVFWSLCLFTTVIAVVMAIIVHPRTWCAFCPIGTLQNFIGGSKKQLMIDKAACKECNLCENVCSFNLPKASYKEIGYLPDRDCLKCSECVSACPQNALSWP